MLSTEGLRRTIHIATGNPIKEEYKTRVPTPDRKYFETRNLSIKVLVAQRNGANIAISIQFILRMKFTCF